jgi:membrane protein DedA with SNARE-associated domain
VLDWIRDVLGGGSYLVLLGLLVLENLFPPIPSEVILPLAGALVEDGSMSFVLALLVATLGSVLGALALYAVGRYGGRPLLYRYNRVFRVSDAQLDRADAWFDRRGPLIVLFGRCIPTVRSVVSIPAGASEMPIPQFLLLTTIGSAVWNAALIGAGWALGENWEDATELIDTVKYPLLAVVLVACVVAVVVAVRRHRRTTPA